MYGLPKRHSSTLGLYKPKNGGGFYYRENLDKFPWDEYNVETKESRKVNHTVEGEAPRRVDTRDRAYLPDQADDADPPDAPDQTEAAATPEQDEVAATPTRDDLLQVYGALQDKDRARSSTFLSFLAAYSETSYSPEAAREVLRGLRVLSGPELLEPNNLRRILEKVGSWRNGAFMLDPEALRGWETHFAELGYTGA